MSDWDEPCSLDCDFAPWRERWGVTLRLLPHMAYHPLPECRDALCDLLADFATELTEFECDCASSRALERIRAKFGMLLTFSPEVMRVNDQGLTSLLVRQVHELDEEVKKAVMELYFGEEEKEEEANVLSSDIVGLHLPPVNDEESGRNVDDGSDVGDAWVTAIFSSTGLRSAKEVDQPDYNEDGDNADGDGEDGEEQRDHGEDQDARDKRGEYDEKKA